MKVLKPDHERRYEIPGVPGAARRPVDVDASQTGFTALRSLRLYRFAAGGVVDGHAEEDEVFVIVTAGSIRISLGWEDTAVDAEGTWTLAAAVDGQATSPFVAYLPPHAVYRLTPLTEADVVYARATPKSGGKPKVFGASNASREAGTSMLFDERSYGERLRAQLRYVDAIDAQIELSLLDAADAGCEALMHVQGTPVEVPAAVSGTGEAIDLQSWDTVAIQPGERPLLTVHKGAQLTVLTVFAA